MRSQYVVYFKNKKDRERFRILMKVISAKLNENISEAISMIAIEFNKKLN